MLSWMLYSIVVSLLMGLAALALERSAQIREGRRVGCGVRAWLLPSRSYSSLPKRRCRCRQRRMPSGRHLPKYSRPRKRKPSNCRGSRCRSLLPINTAIKRSVHAAGLDLAFGFRGSRPGHPCQRRPFIVAATPVGPRSYGRDSRLHLGRLRSCRCRVFSSTYCGAALADKIISRRAGIGDRA